MKLTIKLITIAVLCTAGSIAVAADKAKTNSRYEQETKAKLARAANAERQEVERIAREMGDTKPALVINKPAVTSVVTVHQDKSQSGNRSSTPTWAEKLFSGRPVTPHTDTPEEIRRKNLAKIREHVKTHTYSQPIDVNDVDMSGFEPVNIEQLFKQLNIKATLKN